MFEVNTVKSFDEGTLKLCEKKQDNFIEFVGRTRANNGVKGYLQKLESEPNTGNVISVSQIGTIVAQIRKEEWYASQNIFSLSAKKNSKTLISLFGVAIVNRSLGEAFSEGYSNYPTLVKLKNLKISLPTKNGEIDFDFMESFVAEIEAEKIKNLDEYLEENNLKDYTLNAEEKQILEDFENGKFEWGEFSYKSIFNKIKQGRRLKKDDQILGDIPFVMAGVTNTGVVNYISNPIANFPKNSITVDIFGNTFYRNYDFGAGDDTGVYWNTEKNYSKEMMLFFTTSMKTSLLGKFSYGEKLRSSQSLNLKVNIPTKNSQPDYEKMEILISAIQKMVVKDAVLYVERKMKEKNNE